MNGQGDDPRLMKELAQTFMSAGIIASELGNAAEAHLALLRAKDILEDLLRAHPEGRRAAALNWPDATSSSRMRKD